MKKSIFAILGLLPCGSQAIVNIESMRIGQAAPGFEKNIALGFSGSNGNSDIFESSLSGRINWQGQQDNSFLLADAAYGEANKIKNTENSLLHWRYIFSAGQKTAKEVFVQFQHNSFLKLELRSLAGLGLRHNSFNQANKKLYLGLGTFLEHEQYSEGRIQQQTRLNTYLNYRHSLGENSILSLSAYYQPNLAENSDYRTLSQLALQTAINSHLAINIQLDIAHDSEPLAGVKKTDEKYLTSLVYKF